MFYQTYEVDYGYDIMCADVSHGDKPILTSPYASQQVHSTEQHLHVETCINYSDLCKIVMYILQRYIRHNVATVTFRSHSSSCTCNTGCTV